MEIKSIKIYFTKLTQMTNLLLYINKRKDINRCLPRQNRQHEVDTKNQSHIFESV